MNKPTPYDFLKECFDEIKHCDDPLGRKSILSAYAKHMEAREAEIAKEAYKAGRIQEADDLRGIAQNDDDITPDEYGAILVVLNKRLNELDPIRTNPQQ